MFYIVEESEFGVPIFAKGFPAKNKAEVREKIWNEADYEKLKVLTLAELVASYNTREVFNALENVKEYCFL